MPPHNQIEGSSRDNPIALSDDDRTVDSMGLQNEYPHDGYPTTAEILQYPFRGAGISPSLAGSEDEDMYGGEEGRTRIEQWRENAVASLPPRSRSLGTPVPEPEFGSINRNENQAQQFLDGVPGHGFFDLDRRFGYRAETALASAETGDMGIRQSDVLLTSLPPRPASLRSPVVRNAEVEAETGDMGIRQSDIIPTSPPPTASSSIPVFSRAAPDTADRSGASSHAIPPLPPTCTWPQIGRNGVESAPHNNDQSPAPDSPSAEDGDNGTTAYVARMQEAIANSHATPAQIEAAKNRFCDDVIASAARERREMRTVERSERRSRGRSSQDSGQDDEQLQQDQEQRRGEKAKEFTLRENLARASDDPHAAVDVVMETESEETEVNAPDRLPVPSRITRNAPRPPRPSSPRVIINIPSPRSQYSHTTAAQTEAATNRSSDDEVASLTARERRYRRRMERSENGSASPTTRRRAINRPRARNGPYMGRERQWCGCTGMWHRYDPSNPRHPNRHVRPDETDMWLEKNARVRAYNAQVMAQYAAG